MKKRAIVTASAPKAIGPYSKTTLWLTAAAHFATVNEIYARHFPEPAPARSAPILAGLPRGLLISIEAIAAKPA